MLKEEKGITLVALVLSIVVLLILSGVAVSVFIQNTDMLTPKTNVGSNSGNSSASISYADAQTKVKLIFELYEANYQTELAKGNVTERSEYFTANRIVSGLERYNISGNTERTLGNLDLTNGITVNYGNEYTFLVRVSNTGIVTVVQK